MVEFRKMASRTLVSRRKALAVIGSSASIPRIVLALDGREAAPRFHAKTMSGETINNDSMQGKVVLLQFWATWCQYCKRDMPVLETLGREFEKQGLVVLGVNVGESKKKVKQYLEQSPRSSRVVLMDDTNLRRCLKLKASRFTCSSIAMANSLERRKAREARAPCGICCGRPLWIRTRTQWKTWNCNPLRVRIKTRQQFGRVTDFAMRSCVLVPR